MIARCGTLIRTRRTGINTTRRRTQTKDEADSSAAILSKRRQDKSPARKQSWRQTESSRGSRTVHYDQNERKQDAVNTFSRPDEVIY
jgi:hypothetical protein